MHKLGIYKQGSKYTAAICAQSARSCSLRLYDAGAPEPKEVIAMKEDPKHNSVFFCEFETRADEYDFETDLGVINDPYAVRMSGDRIFGFDRDYVRASMPGTALKFADRAHKSIDYSDMIIYKLHVRGFSKHSSARAEEPGTFKAVTRKVPYIKSLGFNAVLLMPCYDFDEVMPAGFGQPARINYWGYGSPANYFAPKTAYAADPKKACEEFAAMVRTFHASGIEVLMEMDFTPQVPDILTLEALRFWHETYHIDGFRLMSGSFSPRLAATDPYLKSVKLIRNHWPEDCTGTLRLRERPVLAEANEDYMKAVRRFITGDEGVIKEFSDRIRDNGNLAAKVNYFSDHDGFTLADVFSYDVRHNDANNEKNLDGREINYSWNCGVEGETASRTVNRLRLKMIKNALAVLFMSQGTPMLMAGDECGSTHYGNNNPYCCDNEQGWVIWQNNAFANEIRRFTKDMIALRKAHRIFSNIIELRGSDYIHSGCPDVSFHGTKAWYPDFGHFSRTLGMLLNGEYAITDRVNRDTSFYVIFNMHWEEHEFDLPSVNHSTFRFVFATDPKNSYDGGKSCLAAPRSITVFAVDRGGDDPSKKTKNGKNKG